jgi:hypothetical protein
LPSLQPNKRFKHSNRTDLTHLSATVLARGDLKDVRTCCMPRCCTRTRAGTIATASPCRREGSSFVDLEGEFLSPDDRTKRNQGASTHRADSTSALGSSTPLEGQRHRAGIPRWEAAGFLGMSVEKLDRVYGRHLRAAAHVIGYRPREELAMAGARPVSPRTPQPIEIIGGPTRAKLGTGFSAFLGAQPSEANTALAHSAVPRRT